MFNDHASAYAYGRRARLYDTTHLLGLYISLCNIQRRWQLLWTFHLFSVLLFHEQALCWLAITAFSEK
jgi:hypothetical protein